jgi:hypothetical protein
MVDNSDGPIERLVNGGIRISTEKGIEWLSNDEVRALEAKGEMTRTSSLIPDLNAPESTTGGLIKGTAQFVTGMLGANRLLGAFGAPARVGGLARAAKTSGAAALASATAFGPHEERLSNLVERFPALRNPVTRYLAASPDDSAAEGRFKNALEGLGIGALTDGFVKAVKVAGAARRARTLGPGTAPAEFAREAPSGTAATQPGAVRETAGPLPSEASLAVDVQDAPPAAYSSAGPQRARAANVNLDHLDAPDAVKAAISETANRFAGQIHEARRGSISEASVRELA